MKAFNRFKKNLLQFLIELSGVISESLVMHIGWLFSSWRCFTQSYCVSLRLFQRCCKTSTMCKSKQLTNFLECLALLVLVPWLSVLISQIDTDLEYTQVSFKKSLKIYSCCISSQLFGCSHSECSFAFDFRNLIHRSSSSSLCWNWLLLFRCYSVCDYSRCS